MNVKRSRGRIGEARNVPADAAARALAGSIVAIRGLSGTLTPLSALDHQVLLADVSKSLEENETTLAEYADRAAKKPENLRKFGKQI